MTSVVLVREDTFCFVLPLCTILNDIRSVGEGGYVLLLSFHCVIQNSAQWKDKAERILPHQHHGCHSEYCTVEGQSRTYPPSPTPRMSFRIVHSGRTKQNVSSLTNTTDVIQNSAQWKDKAERILTNTTDVIQNNAQRKASAECSHTNTSAVEETQRNSDMKELQRPHIIII